MKNSSRIYIKNSSEDVNCGLHDLHVVFKTDGGRIETHKNYIARFKVNYGTKEKYKTELTLIVSEEDNLR